MFNWLTPVNLPLIHQSALMLHTRYVLYRAVWLAYIAKWWSVKSALIFATQFSLFLAQYLRKYKDEYRNRFPKISATINMDNSGELTITFREIIAKIWLPMTAMWTKVHMRKRFWVAVYVELLLVLSSPKHLYKIYNQTFALEHVCQYMFFLYHFLFFFK